MGAHLGSTRDLTIGAMVIAYLALIVLMQSYLRRIHPQAWKEMGEPTVMPTLDSLRQSFLTVKYLCSPSADRSGDATLIAMVWTIRALFVTAIILIVWMPRS